MAVYQNHYAALALIATNVVIDAVVFWALAQTATSAGDHSTAVWMLSGTAAGSLLLVAGLEPRLLSHRGLWLAPRRFFVTKDFALFAVSRLDWPLVAAASTLIGGLPVAIIVGTRVLVFIPLLHKMTTTADGSRWERVGATRSLLVLATFAGAVLALAAQHDPASSTAGAGGWIRTGAGGALAVAAAVCAATSAARFPLATRIHDELRLSSSGPSRDLAAMLMVHAISSAAVAVVLCVVLGVPSVTVAVPAALIGGLGVTSGLITQSVGCWLAPDLSVNAVSYAMPLAAFVVFWVAGAAPEANTAMLAAAAVLVCAANAALVATVRPSR